MLKSFVRLNVLLPVDSPEEEEDSYDRVLREVSNEPKLDYFLEEEMLFNPLTISSIRQLSEKQVQFCDNGFLFIAQGYTKEKIECMLTSALS